MARVSQMYGLVPARRRVTMTMMGTKMSPPMVGVPVLAR